MNKYFIIPTDDNTNYTWENATQKREAVRLAKEYFAELVDVAGSGLRVDVFTGDEDNGPDTHLDPVFTVQREQ